MWWRVYKDWSQICSSTGRMKEVGQHVILFFLSTHDFRALIQNISLCCGVVENTVSRRVVQLEGCKDFQALSQSLCETLRNVIVSIDPFRSQINHHHLLLHHGSCEVGTKPLVAFTFLKVWSENDFDNFSIERPPDWEFRDHGMCEFTGSLPCWSMVV